MWLVDLIFGARPSPAHSLVHIARPPSDANWRRVRPRGDGRPVRAWLAESDHVVHAQGGDLEAHGGEDMIVAHSDNQRAVVRRDIFDRTYEALGGGLYKKRDDVVLRYFTLDRPAIVETLEGAQEAAPGDWIMQGVRGELWPVPRREAEEKYRPV